MELHEMELDKYAEKIIYVFGSLKYETKVRLYIYICIYICVCVCVYRTHALFIYSKRRMRFGIIAIIIIISSSL
jgi:hypothetical protein